MVRDPLVPPAAFVSYVETRLPSLVRGARRYVGDERFADQLARDLLASVAVRWPWYAGDVRLAGPILRRRRPDPAVAADRFLRKAFKDGVRDVADTDQPVTLLLDPNAEYPEGPAPRTFLEGRLSYTDEAGLLWERAAQSVRRRTLIAGGIGVMGLIVFLSRPKPQGTPGQDAEPGPEPSLRVPLGVDVLPSLSELARLRTRTTPLPAEIDLARAGTAFPRGHRARAIFSPTDQSSVFLLDDGKLYAAPDFGVRVDNTAALSPDGRYVAYRAGKVTLFDVTMGTSHELPASANVGSPVWIDGTRLVVSVVGGVQVLSVDGKAHGNIVADIGDILVPQAPGQNARTGTPGSHLAQLLSLGVPLGAPARVRHFAAGGGVTDLPLTGDLAPSVGLWRGIGFSRGTDVETQLLTRRCQSNLRLPAEAGEPESGIAAIRSRAAAVLRMVVATSNTGAERVEPVGWLDEATVLIAANSADASIVVAWRIDTGELNLVSMINSAVRMAVADLTDVVQ